MKIVIRLPFGQVLLSLLRPFVLVDGQIADGVGLVDDDVHFLTGCGCYTEHEALPAIRMAMRKSDNWRVASAISPQNVKSNCPLPPLVDCSPPIPGGILELDC